MIYNTYIISFFSAGFLLRREVFCFPDISERLHPPCLWVNSTVRYAFVCYNRFSHELFETKCWNSAYGKLYRLYLWLRVCGPRGRRILANCSTGSGTWELRIQRPQYIVGLTAYKQLGNRGRLHHLLFHLHSNFRSPESN